MCNRGDLLVSYVYDEISDGDRQDVERHLAVCGDCRAEIDGIRSTRGHLALWAPPEPELGFRLIRGSAEPAPALPRRRFAPAFAFAAAAVVVLAAAAAVANLEVRYGNFVLRAGWTPSAAAPAAGGQVQPVADRTAEADLAGLEERLRQIETAVAQGAAGAQAASGPRMTDAELLSRVRRMVDAVEARQDAAVATRLLQLVQDLERQRRADLAYIQHGFVQSQGVTNVELATQRDRLNQYILANTRQDK